MHLTSKEKKKEKNRLLWK